MKKIVFLSVKVFCNAKIIFILHLKLKHLNALKCQGLFKDPTRRRGVRGERALKSSFGNKDREKERNKEERRQNENV